MINKLINDVMSTTGQIYIVGAHSRAQTVAAYLGYLYPSVMVKAFLVDNEEENAEEIDGVPVIRLDKDTKLHGNCPVFIGTRGIYHASIAEKLNEFGIQQIYPVTVELDLKLRNMFLKRYLPSIGRKFEKIDEIKESTVLAQGYSKKVKACVYVAKSIYDKPLQRSYIMASYERPIQVGASLTEERLSNGVLTDNEGENISIKNKQYCELTALYWIWKHANEDVIGLVHYRRHFLLPDDWLEYMTTYEIDVILPIPLYVTPSLEKNYKKRHDSLDWDYMMRNLDLYHKEDYFEAKAFFQGNLYSPCNMFIMKKEVLDDLCEWLFPILDAVVECVGKKEDYYLNRYPGFISERLITFFFERHRDKYKVVYADKNFLS
ncbi:DUF4422 domain-containing protein [Lacrimispora sp.]|uniref:DUF4422 domain-containing protein n=1 Tax=Lacrimispora sp. TaxID=2719234 RepID=UPI00289D1BD5|nr:DUF4422 domain-containing protein [Lacrimispora sp.]